MTELVSPNKIEQIVGARRHREWHIARAVSAQQKVFILHSQECLAGTPDLRQCAYSVALDQGISAEHWDGLEDRPVRVRVRYNPWTLEPRPDDPVEALTP